MSANYARSPSASHATSVRPAGLASVASATSIAHIKAVVGQLSARHATVTSELDDAVESHAQLVRQLSRLDLSRARLGTLSNSARALSHGQLAPAAATAAKLSDAVSRLDLEQERVKATLAVVEQVSELKACVLGVVGSMGALQDWETAAEYISRASKIPNEVIVSGFAEGNVPTAEVPEPPAATLDEAAKSLCRLFLREFDSAVKEADGARITRFFKMFPLIGRSREGLDAYGRYVCQGVAVRARSRLQGVSAVNDGFGYVNALTKLFEHIAQVVDGHSPLVQRHYGSGTMVKVIEHLHLEAANIQGGIILDTWNDERSIDRKLTEVKSYAYNFLVQSFLPVNRASGTPRSQSPAPGSKPKLNPDQPEDGIEMREIDQVLSEITAMLSHWSLYVRFISSRSMMDDAEDHVEDGDAMSESDLPALQAPDFLTTSDLPKKVVRFLVEPFNHLSTFFLRRSVERAFQMEEKPTGLSLDPSKPISINPPFITSAVDDVMYMVNQVLQRSLATSQASVVGAVISNVGRILGGDFIGMTQRKMRDESYPKAAIQGTRPPEDKVLFFLVLMNNLDVAIDYLKRIVGSHIPELSDATGTNSHANDSRTLEDLFPMGEEARNVRSALLNLESVFSSKAAALIEDGMSVLFSHVLQPLMRPYLADIFRDIDYSADENGHDKRRHPQDNDDDDEEEQSVSFRAQTGWSARIKPLKRILTARNSEKLASVAVSYLSSLVEKRIWTYHGRVSELGAVRLESDIADLCNAVVKGESFRMREAFSRCLQIVSIMNMENEEWEEVLADHQEGGTSWALKDKELRRARTMIKDRNP